MLDEINVKFQSFAVTVEVIYLLPFELLKPSPLSVNHNSYFLMRGRQLWILC